MEKCLMDVVTPLIANREPAVLRKPAQCALHHPPVSPQLLAALNSLSCYPAPDGTLPEGFLALFVVVSFVSVKFLGPLSRSATGSLDGLYAVDQLFENHRVVDVCRAELHTERDASSVRNKVALRARFSFIRRIRSGFWAPLLAGMEAESKQARSHSIWSASPRRFKSTRCRRSQSPASCHSRNRRQHVTPEPQPISWGNISQGMPLFSTKMMPVRAARSSTRGLPPCGLGDSGGSSSSITSHSSSLTNSLAIFSTYPDPVVLKGSLSKSPEMLGNTPTQQCGDFQQFCKVWKPLENYLAALAWRGPRIRVSSGPLPFYVYLQVKTREEAAEAEYCLWLCAATQPALRRERGPYTGHHHGPLSSRLP